MVRLLRRERLRMELYPNLVREQANRPLNPTLGDMETANREAKTMPSGRQHRLPVSEVEGVEKARRIRGPDYEGQA